MINQTIYLLLIVLAWAYTCVATRLLVQIIVISSIYQRFCMGSLSINEIYIYSYRLIEIFVTYNHRISTFL